jgi:hypothetical protein
VCVGSCVTQNNITLQVHVLHTLPLSEWGRKQFTAALYMIYLSVFYLSSTKGQRIITDIYKCFTDFVQVLLKVLLSWLPFALWELMRFIHKGKTALLGCACVNLAHSMSVITWSVAKYRCRLCTDDASALPASPNNGSSRMAPHLL